MTGTTRGITTNPPEGPPPGYCSNCYEAAHFDEWGYCQTCQVPYGEDWGAPPEMGEDPIREEDQEGTGIDFKTNGVSFETDHYDADTEDPDQAEKSADT